jgi:hypothetical protein
MLHHASAAGGFDRRKAVMETLLAFKRAGERNAVGTKVAVGARSGGSRMLACSLVINHPPRASSPGKFVRPPPHLSFCPSVATGASIYITYFAPEVLRWLDEDAAAAATG